MAEDVAREGDLAIEVIEDLDGLRRIESDWVELLGLSPNVSAWAAPSAILTWFDLVQSHSGIYVVAVRRGHRLVGLAPFSSIGVGPFRVYVTAGAGFGYYGEPLLGDDPGPVAKALATHIERTVQYGSAVFYLRRLRVDGAFTLAIDASSQVASRLMSPDEEISIVRFSEMSDTDDYFHEVGKRHEVPRLYRRLSENFEFVEYQVEDPEPLAAMADMRDMMQRRFEEDLRIFSTQQNRALLSALVVNMSAAGDGHVASFTVDGKRGAVAFVLHAGTYHTWYAVAYEPDLRKWGLGHVEPFEMLTRALASGATDVDLGDARFEYKATWANETIHNRTFAVAAPGLRGRAADVLRSLAIRLHRRRNLDRIGGAGPHVI